jgi:Tol biopolymer transport system component
MNNHQTWRDSLAYYHRLPAEERRRVDDHLASCAECRATLAAYERQDAALANIPMLRPRAWQWRPGRAQPAERWLNLFGQALALGGIAALLWMFALQAQFASQLGPGTSANAPAQLVPESGIAIPPAVVSLPSPWLPALPWLGASLLVIGLLIALSGRRRWPAVVGSFLAAGLLVCFVSPLSALPNLAGIYWRLAGGYGYDPNLPFKNDFLIAGRPEKTLRPYLDKLIGEVGLSPLDPVQPLRGYEILRVGLHPHHNRIVLVTTRFIYADGSSRIYPVPLMDPAQDLRGFWLSGWRSDGLERLRSQHLALPGQPFARPDAPVRVGAARRIDRLSPAANRLDEINPSHWLWGSVRVQHLVWAPDGQSFLTAMEIAPGRRQLWVVPLDGSAPKLVASGDIREYGWSPDGGNIVFTLFDPAAAAIAPDKPYAIQAVPSGHVGQPPIPLVTRLSSAQQPGLSADGVWFFADGNLWRAAYSGGQPHLVASGLGATEPSGEPRPAPGGGQVTFACSVDLCLMPLSSAQANGTPTSIQRAAGLEPAEISWSFDGSLLAVVDRSSNPGVPVKLAVVGRDGQVIFSSEIAPSDVTEAPQWTPDGKTVLIQTYPYQGRRIIAVDLASRQATDLSQEHWDAYFALSPDGTQLLLNNGRGDFWTADLIRRN